MKANKIFRISLFILSLSLFTACKDNRIVVFQSDFGLKDGAVSAMKGVALGVSADLKLEDITHEIPAYNVWEAAYRLEQTVPYYPKGTVFVSVVDPGVGTDRKSVVLKTRSGHYIVTPDNGTLTLVSVSLGIDEIREINETLNRRRGSNQSYTFHGRDVYAYTAARLAAGKITFEEVGKLLPKNVISIPHQKAVLQNGKLRGNIPILDVQYGNIWTNIDNTLLEKFNLKYNDVLKVAIYHNEKQVYNGLASYHETFGSVKKGSPLLYLNSLMQLSLALNMENFALKNGIGSGAEWNIEITR